jgi:formate hydrogenlyase subunit 3/multisubunit Na+/H+ antiporter MnhD subunit
MSSALIWILTPLLVGIVLFFLHRWKTTVYIAGIFLTLNLSLAAGLLPIDEMIVAGSQSFTILSRYQLMGLNFVLTNSDRSLLVLLYFGITFIFGGVIAAHAQPRFIPLGLTIVAFIIAAISVEPGVYGALFFQPVILLCAFLLSPPGFKVSKGVLRFLIFQVIGLAFVLIAGWLFSANPDTTDIPADMLAATLLLGSGFLFLFSIFPLYAWVTMVVEDTHPYAAVFVFSMVFGGYSLFLLSIFSHYTWLLTVPGVFEVIRLMGVIMVATGGVWAAFQRNLGRLVGYAVVIEVGHALLSIGLRNSGLFYAMLVPRLLSLSVWGLGLSVLRPYVVDLRFSTVQGMARQFPVAGAAVLFSHFSLAGMPLMAGFPVLLSLWSQLSPVSTSMIIWTFLGSVGLMAGALRSLAVLVMGPEVLPWNESESLNQKVYLILGMVGIVFVGLFPQWVYPFLSGLSGSLNFFSP